MKSIVIPIVLLLADSAQLSTASTAKHSAPEISRSIRQRLDAYGRRQAGEWVEILAESESMFFAPGQPYRLEFVSDASGVVTSLVFRQQGQRYIAQRLP